MLHRSDIGQHLAVSTMRVPERVTRRPIPSREAPWAIQTARWLQRTGVTPNQISVLSVVIAIIAAICFVLAGQSEGGTRAALLVAAAIAMPLRLLCHMLDGMLAVEGGLQSPSGEIYNELPDRLSDPLIIAGAGYAIPDLAWGPELGWAAATVALLTAYVRTLGAAAGASQHFTGPMAKPRRMHVLIVACLLSAIGTLAGWQGEWWALVAALILVIAGGVVTIIVRLRRIVTELEAG
jgi:phosphatidylglycerophosphate synthase